MGKYKRLYESSQVMEEQIRLLTTQLAEYQFGYNPTVCNGIGYNTKLRAMDKIQACNRYIFDLPELDLPSNRLEEMFYEYGSLCFFYDVQKQKPMVTSYAKTGSLNELGDLTEVQPIDFAGNTYKEKRTVVYRNSDIVKNPCVIINDYTFRYTEDDIPSRSAINTVSITDQAYVYKQLRNTLKIIAKKAIGLIDSETQRTAYEQVFRSWINSDDPLLVVSDKNLANMLKLHNLDTRFEVEPMLRLIENYERLRSNFNGIKTRSSLDKKERLITSEAENDNYVTDINLFDGLNNRKIGLELMKKYEIVTTGSVKINPVLLPEVQETKQSEKDNNDNPDSD